MEPNIIISRQKEYEQTLHEMVSEGATKLHVLADFDNTLTKAFVKGRKVPSMISVLRDNNYLAPGYAKKAKALYEKYSPFEVNPTISKEEKKE